MNGHRKQHLGRDGGSSRAVLCPRRQECPWTPLRRGPRRRHRRRRLRGTVSSPPCSRGWALPERGIWVSGKVSQEPAPGSHDRSVYGKARLGSRFHQLLGTGPQHSCCCPLSHRLSHLRQISITFLFLLSWFRAEIAVWLTSSCTFCIPSAPVLLGPWPLFGTLATRIRGPLGAGICPRQITFSHGGQRAVAMAEVCWAFVRL